MRQQMSTPIAVGTNRGLHGLTLESLVFLLALFLLSACTPLHVEMPSYEGLSLQDALTELQRIAKVEAVLSVQYEKNDQVMSGDAAVAISRDQLTLRIYYLGILAGEIKEEQGVIQSKPRIDRTRSVVLVDGLRGSFLWWNITDFTITERDDCYVLRNATRVVEVSKKTLLPLSQTIEAEDGHSLTITYSRPSRIVDDQGAPLGSNAFPAWYPSEVRIEYRSSVVKVTVKSLTVKREST